MNNTVDAVDKVLEHAEDAAEALDKVKDAREKAAAGGFGPKVQALEEVVAAKSKTVMEHWNAIPKTGKIAIAAATVAVGAAIGYWAFDRGSRQTAA